MKKLITISLILFLFFFTHESHAVANPTIIGTNTTGTTGVVNPSFSHTVPSGGQNKILLVLIMHEGDHPTAMTWNGAAMTRIAIIQPGLAIVNINVWYIVNPEVGTYTVSITKTTQGDSGWIALTLQDVNQTTPQDATGTATSGGTGTSWTSDIGTPAADSLTINIGAVANGTAWTVGTGQTEIEAPFEMPSVGDYEFVSSYEVGEDIMTETWTNSVGYEQGSVAFNYQAPTVSAVSPRIEPNPIIYE